MKRPALNPSSPQGSALAKTTRPVMSAIIARERLYTKLDATPARTVMWIAGPPGAGKTTLAASYVAARGLSSLWYQVDADDEDAATLFHFLKHAAAKLEGTGLQNLPSFDPDSGEEVSAFARRFFRQLLAGTRPPFALVLDNLHAIAPESALARTLEGALSQIPKGSCVIVTCRSGAPPSLARLRVTGEMVVVDADQLRIDASELKEIAAVRGHTLDDATVATLEERTRGWLAALVLMLEHAKLTGQLAEVPAEAVPDVVFDYLAGEIFDRFDAKTRQFLLRLACLPRMTVAIARELAGEEKAGRLLLNLTLNNYFLTETRVGDERSYRFHPLMREFLCARAGRDAPQVLQPAHLRRAARLLNQAGYVEDAVTLCVESADWDQLCEIASREATALLAQGRHEILALWLESLPAAALSRHANLLMVFGACRAAGSPRNARRLYDEAFEQFRAAGDQAGMAQCLAGVVEAIIADFDDLAPLDRWIGEAARLLENHEPRLVAPAARALALAALVRGSADKKNQARAAQSDMPIARAVASALSAEPAAADLAALSLPDRSRGANRPSAGLGMALVALIAGDYPAAGTAAEESITATGARPPQGQLAWLRSIAAAAALGAGNLEPARNELRRLELTGEALRRGDRALLHYLRAWLADAEGDSAGARREARSAVALAAETGLIWCEALARIGLARLLAENGDQRGADLHLRVARSLTADSGNLVLEHALHMAGAEISLASSATDAGMAIQRAFTFGREHGLRVTPWWRGRAAAAVCVRAFHDNIETEYARELVRSCALAPTDPPLRVARWPWVLRIETLGEFRLMREDRPIEFSGKGPGRPAELLKVLLAQGGQNVRADVLADALWPNAEADYAHKSFTAALHRLRRLLGDDAALILRDGRLNLNPDLVYADSWALEEVLAESETLMRSAPASNPPAALGALLEEVWALYRGPFLADDSEQPGYIACREQLRARLLRSLTRVLHLWEEAGMYVQAADALLRLIDADPLFEGAYRQLMLFYQRRGELAEARAAYERLRGTLAMRQKTLPGAETQALYAALVTAR